MFDICHDTTGLVLLPSFVSPSDQKSLVRWSLCGQARNPNETNLDTHYILPEEGLWNEYVKSLEYPADDVLIQPRVSTMADPGHGLPEPPARRKLIANAPASTENFQSLSTAPKPPPVPSSTLQASPSSSLIHKLRWANIGWSYHWGTKQYDFTKGKGKVNTEIRDVCKCAVELVDWDAVFDGSCEDNLDWGEDDWQTWSDTYGMATSSSLLFVNKN
jgi:alkylated DNA repair protein alkB family protein 1